MLTVNRNFLAQALRVAGEQYTIDAQVMVEQAKTLPNFTRVADQFRKQAADCREIANTVENGKNIRLEE